MSFEWKKEKLKNLCLKIGSGATPRGGQDAYLDNGEFSLIRSQNILDFTFSYNGLAFIDEKQANQLNNVIIEENDILLNITGDSVARVCQVPIDVLPARVNQHVSIVRPKSDILFHKFLKYYLLNPVFKDFMLGLSSVGGTRNALTKGMIEDFEISLPPLKTQEKIAEILSSFDDKIELNRQMNATLEAIAQTLFKEWFGGNTEGALREGWRMGKLREIGIIITGKTPSSQNMEHFGNIIPFVTPTDFKNYGKIIISAERGISNEGIKAFKYKILPMDSVIVTCIGSDMGKVAINKIECLTNQQINSIILNSEITTSDYVYYYLVEKYELLKSIASGGSTMPIINKSQFETIDIVLPPIELAKKFQKIVNDLNIQIEANLKENQTLTQLRDSLLPKLLRGEIAV